jgi:hypothetical protein
MNVRTGYQLNVDTIESLDDVKIILDKLNLTTYPEGGDWEVLQKYFTTEVQTPTVPFTLPTEEELVAANSSFLDVAATSDV